MKRILRIAGPLGALLWVGAAFGTVSVTLPRDPYQFKAGPGQNLAIANCTTCHSAGYVYTQPPFTKTQWTAEVNKMVKAYGAPIAPGDVAGIVDYLMTQDGKQ